MTKLFKKIKKVDKAIKEKRIELLTTEDPLNGYFLKIGNEEERKENIAEINIELKALYSTKFALLESVERMAGIEKINISRIERGLTLLINR